MSGSAAGSRSPKVSVSLITFNHEPYIDEAVESVLAQRTAFDVEVLVGEDGSTDRTRGLLDALRARSPGALTLLPSSPRLGGPANLARTLAACRGQYVAILEGDDYWTSPAKLQRQADFLDGRPECAMVFHDVRVIEESPPAPERAADVARLRRQLARQAAAGRDTIPRDALLRECVVPMGSVMLRRAACPPIPDWYRRSAIGDWPLHALAAEGGAIGYINEALGVYRIHDRGASWSRSPLQRCLDAIDTGQYLDAHLGGRYRGVQQRLTLLHFRAALLYRGQGDGRAALFHARRAVALAARRPAAVPGLLGAGLRWLMDRRQGTTGLSARGPGGRPAPVEEGPGSAP
jgi:glycosyltransferase involved in cell wall biosynthesis